MKIINYVAYLVIALAIGMMGYFFYYQFYPFKPIAGLPSVIEPVNKTVAPGGTVTWKVNFCKTGEEKATTETLLFTTARSIGVAKGEFNAGKGCYEFTPAVIIPDEAIAGEAYLESTAIYKYKFGREVIVKVRIGSFTITGDNKIQPLNPSPKTPSGDHKTTNPINTPSVVIPPVTVPNPQTSGNNNPTVNANIATQITTPKICVPIINLCL
jgi:hypothetical protein